MPISVRLAWRRTRKRSEPRTGGSLLRRLPSPIYDERKVQIQDPFFREAIDLAEEAVLTDPNPLREDRLLQDGIGYDTSSLGVGLSYEVIDDGEGDGVRFLSFSDLWNR